MIISICYLYTPYILDVYIGLCYGYLISFVFLGVEG